MKTVFYLKPIALLAVAALAIGSFAQDSGKTIFESRLLSAADPIRYRDLVQEGIRLYSTAKFAEAVPKLQSALAQYPEDGMVWLYLGLALRSSGKPKEAVDAYDHALRLRSSGQPFIIYQWLARAYLEAGQKENAYRALEKAIFQEPHPNRPGIYDDPALKSLRSEPRFKKLVGQVDTSKMSRTEGWRTDIDYLVSEIKRVNHRYKDHPFPPIFMKRYHDLKRDVPKLTDDEIYIRMGGMISPLKQAHMTVALLEETKLSPLRTLPVQFYAFPDGVFIVGSDRHQDLIGSEVLKIEGHNPDEVLRMAEEHHSVENPMRILWGIGDLGVIQVLRGLGIVKPGHEEVKLTLRTPDGQTVERVMTTVRGAQPRKLVPPAGVTPPLFLKDVPRAHWFTPLEGDALFVQLNQVSPDPNETMAQFGLKLRKYLNETPVKNIILDVRHNNGGNTATYTELLRTLVSFSTQDGHRLFIIIGRGVYSATGNLITDLERLASPIFVGEPSSGFGNQDGDESQVTLPYSGIHGWVTSVWWQYSHPWDKRTSIIPDVPVQLTAKAYFAGEDPVLETIMKLIKRDQPPK